MSDGFVARASRLKPLSALFFFFFFGVCVCVGGGGGGDRGDCFNSRDSTKHRDLEKIFPFILSIYNVN